MYSHYTSWHSSSSSADMDRTPATNKTTEPFESVDQNHDVHLDRNASDVQLNTEPPQQHSDSRVFTQSEWGKAHKDAWYPEASNGASYYVEDNSQYSEPCSQPDPVSYTDRSGATFDQSGEWNSGNNASPYPPLTPNDPLRPTDPLQGTNTYSAGHPITVEAQSAVNFLEPFPPCSTVAGMSSQSSFTSLDMAVPPSNSYHSASPHVDEMSVHGYPHGTPGVASNSELSHTYRSNASPSSVHPFHYDPFQPWSPFHITDDPEADSNMRIEYVRQKIGVTRGNALIEPFSRELDRMMSGVLTGAGSSNMSSSTGTLQPMDASEDFGLSGSTGPSGESWIFPLFL